MINKIFVVGYYGRRNVGDDAMLFALLQEIHTINPKLKFAILSSIPVTIPPRIEEVVYINQSIFNIMKEIFNSSVVAIGGGTHLFDHGYKIKALKIQLKLFLLLLFAKLAGREIWLLSNGLGPLLTNWGKFFPKLICRMADYISVRDMASYNYLVNWGFEYKSVLAFDLAALIEYPRDNSETKVIKKDKKILGISVIPVFEFYYKSKDKDAILIKEISKHVNNWLEQESQAEVRLFIFHGESRKEDDISFTKLLQNTLQQHRSSIVYYDPNPKKMLAEVDQCSAFIGMRYHSCVFAYMNELPLLIIDYHYKCRALADEIKLPKHAVISLEEMLDGKFGEYFRNFQEHPEDFVAALPVETAKTRAKKGLPSKMLMG